MRLRPYCFAKRCLKACVSGKWNPVSRNITGTARSMRLIRCASTTPPPPKLTVRAALPGNAVTTQVRIVSGSAPRSAEARSRTSPGLSIGPAPEVVELDEARSEEHTSELQSHSDLVCRLLLEKKK